MRARFGLALFALALTSCGGNTGAFGPDAPNAPNSTLVAALDADLQQYLIARSAVEHISAASLSISLHGQSSTIDVAAGATTYGGTTPVTPAMLYQIGSNTKAFTAVIILQMEAEHKLAIDQTLGQWLPQYSTWKNVTIRQLLNMTSGIATYDATDAWEAAFASAPTQFESPAQLIGYVDPNAPPQPGWTYSNTGYILSQLIIEKAGGDSYATELQNRIIGPLGLHNTYYNADIYPASIQSQTVSGYFASTDADNAGLQPLLFHDMKPLSTSWAQAAGGIVSNPSDLTKWARALYQGSIMQAAQRAELETLVSTKTGQPIPGVTSSDPRGFGLGVSQALQPFGTIWFYEGETLGYRVLHAYLPQSDAVIAIGLNSQPNAADDQIGALASSVIATLKDYNQI